MHATRTARTLALSLSLLLLLPLVCRSEEKAEGVRTIDLKGVKLKNKPGKVAEPAAIVKAEELESFLADPTQAANLTRGVDFAKSKLLLFTWAGSGRDQLVAALDKDTVVFAYTRGLTRDLRQHALLFAVPKDAKFEVRSPR